MQYISHFHTQTPVESGSMAIQRITVADSPQSIAFCSLCNWPIHAKIDNIVMIITNFARSNRDKILKTTVKKINTIAC